MIVAVVIIVATSLGGSPPAPASIADRVAAHPRYWIVRPGQTLSSIAAREGLALGDVERLNPRLLANSLASGQRVRLP
jgi:LysM repeat protein